jgi:predicted nucleic acid-binding protein
VKVALDTNILAYAEGVNGADRAAAARDLVQRLPADAVVLPVQVLGELFNVLVRKAKWMPDAARTAILSWHDTFAVIDTSMVIMAAAADLAHDHQLSIWDAVMLAAAADGGCRLLLSEDLQDGFTWRGVTVANPFAPTRHPLLVAFLAD